MPPRIEAAKTATFETDDKRAQYARLAVFNHGRKIKVIPADVDVNTVKSADLQKAFADLNGGTFLAGSEGIDAVMGLTKDGADDPKVAERGLTRAYAQEVRPFIKKGLLAPSFKRRGGLSEEAKAERDKKKAEADAAREQKKAEKDAANKKRAEEKAARDAAKKEKEEKAAADKAAKEAKANEPKEEKKDGQKIQVTV